MRVKLVEREESLWKGMGYDCFLSVWLVRLQVAAEEMQLIAAIFVCVNEEEEDRDFRSINQHEEDHLIFNLIAETS